PAALPPRVAPRAAGRPAGRALSKIPPDGRVFRGTGHRGRGRKRFVAGAYRRRTTALSGEPGGRAGTDPAGELQAGRHAINIYTKADHQSTSAARPKRT